MVRSGAGVEKERQWQGPHLATTADLVGVPSSKREMEKIETEKDIMTGELVWDDKPCMADQMHLKPNTTKMMAPRFEIFEVSNPEQRELLNNLLARSYPPGCPEIIILHEETRFTGKAWTHLIKFSEVKYLRLMPRKVSDDPPGPQHEPAPQPRAQPREPSDPFPDDHFKHPVQSP